MPPPSGVEKEESETNGESTVYSQYCFSVGVSELGCCHISCKSKETLNWFFLLFLTSLVSMKFLSFLVMFGKIRLR